MYKPGRPRKYDPASGTGQKPPAAPGEYRIRDKDGSIAYIGETNNLARRTGEHLRSGKLSPERGNTIEYQTADRRSTSHTRRVHEQQKIAEHSPTMNRSKGGEGRPAGK